MPNGLRMDRAFDAATGTFRLAADIGTGEGRFLCDNCRCLVSWVRPHVVGGHDERLRRNVPAFFRLMPDVQHADGCGHTLGGRVVELVRESRAVEDAPDPFDDRQNGGYIFRINIPRQEVLAQQGEGEEYNPNLYRERVERVWSGERLAPYCRSAVGLARLWALMDDDHADLQRAVTIQDRGREIPWEQFFFPPTRYASLARRIETNDLDHAVATLVVVRRHGHNQRGPFVEGVGEPGRTRERSIIAPQIYLPENLRANFQVGGRYIVFGTWNSYNNEWKSRDGKATITYRNLTMSIFQPAQFCVINLPAEGEVEEEVRA